MVRSNGFSGFDEWVWALLDERARSWVFWVRRSRFLGSSEFGLFFLSLSLSLSLSLRVGAISLSLSSLSVFQKMIFEGKIKTKIILHPNTGQLKSISGKCIFQAQPNTCIYGKAFPEVIFTQYKHSLSQIVHEIVHNMLKLLLTDHNFLM